MNDYSRRQIDHNVIYTKEQEAKRQILAEVKQREAVKRISAKYESGGVGLRNSVQMADNVDVLPESGLIVTVTSDEKTCHNKPKYEVNGDMHKNTVGNADAENLLLPDTRPSNSADKHVKKCNKTTKLSRPSSATSGYRSGGFSDAASDISDHTVSSSSSGVSSSIGSAVTMTSAPENVDLTDLDIAQVELFYQSHKSEVHVCKCMANLYFGNVEQKLIKDADWKLYATGIPVLVLDTGLHHRIRRLYFVIAERGTGFVLWKDILDNLSRYSAPHANFHSLQVSTDHTKLAGVSFDDNACAAEFLREYEKFTSNPDDDLMKLSTQRHPIKKEKRKSKYKGPAKSEISQPCCFVHMTTIQRPDIAPLCEPDNFTPDVDYVPETVRDETGDSTRYSAYSDSATDNYNAYKGYSPVYNPDNTNLPLDSHAFDEPNEPNGETISAHVGRNSKVITDV